MPRQFPNTQLSLALTRFTVPDGQALKLSMGYIEGMKLAGTGYVVVPLRDVDALIADLQHFRDETEREYGRYLLEGLVRLDG